MKGSVLVTAKTKPSINPSSTTTLAPTHIPTPTQIPTAPSLSSYTLYVPAAGETRTERNARLGWHLRTFLVAWQKKGEALEIRMPAEGSETRKLTHDACGELGLGHETVGEGAERTVFVTNTQQ